MIDSKSKPNDSTRNLPDSTQEISQFKSGDSFDKSRQNVLHIAAMDAVRQGILATEPDGKVVYWNLFAETLFGFSSAAILGRSITEVIKLKSDGFEWEKVVDELNSSPSWSREIVLGRNNGTSFPAVLILSPVYNASGGLEQIVAIISDLTHVKRAEAAREQLEQQLRHAQKMEALGTLAAGVAHDFNNILTIILGHSELISVEYEDRNAVLESVDRISAATKRARSLVTQILAFCQPHQDEHQMVRLDEIVSRTVASYSNTLPEGIRVSHQKLQNEVQIHGDPAQIQQVISNLAANAFYAMKGRQGLLKFAEELVCVDDAPSRRLLELAAGTYVCLSVFDSGVGIDPSVLPRIFEPFFTTKRQGEGAGLGLAVVHGIMRAHNGTVRVESSLGTGTVFRLYFPTANQKRRLPLFSQQGRGNGEKILLLDDDEGIIRFVTSVLTNTGYVVHAYRSANNALDEINAAKQGYHLAIADFCMPEMNGVEFLSKVVKSSPTTRTLLITGFAENVRAEYTNLPDFVALLPKPFTKEMLVQSVHSVLT